MERQRLPDLASDQETQQDPGAVQQCTEKTNWPDLCRAKVTELQLMSVGIDQQVLWLDVPVADAHLVNVRQSSAHLEDIQLDKEGRHALPALAVVLADAKHRLGHELQHQVQEHLRFSGAR